MKRIQLLDDTLPPRRDSPYSHHHAYEVFLGNRRRIQFTSRRDAMAYMAETRRWLHELLLEVNGLHAEAYTDYRQAWPVLSDVRRRKLAETDPLLREHHRQAQWHLDRAGAPTPKRDSLTWAWLDLGRALERTKATYAVLEQLYQYKTQGVLRWRMAAQARRCTEIQERLHEYGAAPAYGRAVT